MGIYVVGLKLKLTFEVTRSVNGAADGTYHRSVKESPQLNYSYFNYSNLRAIEILRSISMENDVITSCITFLYHKTNTSDPRQYLLPLMLNMGENVSKQSENVRKAAKALT